MNDSSHQGSSELTDTEVSQWTALISNECGIDLGRGKAYLIVSRLEPLLSQFKVSTTSELYKLAISARQKGIMSQIISAISTHETSFMRDKVVFEVLKNRVIPSLFESRDDLRMWSAACSSGQEPYSLAIICKELSQKYSRKDVQIVGTDICAKSIEIASKGIYSDFELRRGLDDERIRRYFTVVKEGNRVCDSLRSLVEFRTANLFDPQTRGKAFDLVLCRNAAMYFPRKKRIELYASLAASLRSGGVLVLGVTESMVEPLDSLRMKVMDNCTFFVKC